MITYTVQWYYSAIKQWCDFGTYKSGAFPSIARKRAFIRAAKMGATENKADDWRVIDDKGFVLLHCSKKGIRFDEP